jgi:hypothetical protein
MLFGQAEGEVSLRLQGKILLRPALLAKLLSRCVLEVPSRQIYSEFLKPYKIGRTISLKRIASLFSDVLRS